MSALPGQDVYSWKNTLKKVMMLKPEHISAYSLIIEEGTPFYERFGEPQRKLDCGAQMAGTLPAPKTAAEVAARAAVMTLAGPSGRGYGPGNVSPDERDDVRPWL